MKKYGEFAMLDSLAIKYNYTHDQVFNLSWREAYTMMALGREQLYIETKASEMKRESEKNRT
ncbi:unnamed protein product [marine sediment metagenome]|uniref:Uncharacterized protein n=1 Tax=marine sediment metagenome TaxID=412755 RepID=X0YHS6_9ZZZZ